LRIAFQPGEHAVDVEVTLAADESPDPDNRVSEVWSVPPAGAGRKGRKPPSAFVQVEAMYRLPA
jgi:hypothetical protein